MRVSVAKLNISFDFHSLLHLLVRLTYGNEIKNCRLCTYKTHDSHEIYTTLKQSIKISCIVYSMPK